MIALIQESGTTQQQLQEAAIKYGIPLAKAQKLPLKSLQQLVAVGAAMAC